MIRRVSWECFGSHSMPVPQFVAEVLGMWDAIAWEHWRPVLVTFNGITKTAEEWEQTMASLLNPAEKAQYEKLMQEKYPQKTT